MGNDLSHKKRSASNTEQITLASPPYKEDGIKCGGDETGIYGFLGFYCVNISPKWKDLLHWWNDCQLSLMNSSQDISEYGLNNAVAHGCSSVFFTTGLYTMWPSINQVCDFKIPYAQRRNIAPALSYQTPPPGDFHKFTFQTENFIHFVIVNRNPHFSNITGEIECKTFRDCEGEKPHIRTNLMSMKKNRFFLTSNIRKLVGSMNKHTWPADDLHQ